MAEEIKLVLAIPSTGQCRDEFTYSLAGMVSCLASRGCPTRPEASLAISMDMQKSSVIHGGREALVKRAINNGQTHLMFLDHDMEFAPNVAEIMLGRRLPVVACNYVIKCFPIEFVAVSPCGRRVLTKEDSVGLQEIAYSGFGVSVFELRAFQATPQPWFLPKYIAESDSYTTEDNPCFERLRAAGFPGYVDHDASKLVKHHGDFAYEWRQWKPRDKSQEVKTNGSDKS